MNNTTTQTYRHPDGSTMLEVAPHRFVRAESLVRDQTAQSLQSLQSISDCDCPLHATRNNKPA